MGRFFRAAVTAAVGVGLALGPSASASANPAPGTVTACGYGNATAYRSYINDNMGHIASHWDLRLTVKYKFCRVYKGNDFSIPTGVVAYYNREPVHKSERQNWCTIVDPFAFILERLTFGPEGNRHYLVVILRGFMAETKTWKSVKP
jgi:hypothetical protein